MEDFKPRIGSTPDSMRREQLLAMADVYFSCFSVEHRQPYYELRMLKEHYQDVTDQMCAYLEGVLKVYVINESLGASEIPELGVGSHKS